MRVDGHWNTIVDRGYWRNAYKARRLLRYVVPFGKDIEIAVAGSSALLWFQDEEEIGPMWEGPNDIDIFVAGYYGMTKKRFTKFMEAAESRLRGAGNVIVLKKQWRNRYCIRDRYVYICDLTIEGLGGMKLSFIQSPTAPTVEDVVSAFDIDVCRVIYLIHQERFIVSDMVRRQIERCEAWVDPLMFDAEDGLPTSFDDIKLRSSFRRMRKYAERGFNFSNRGGVVFGRQAAVRRVSF